MTSRERFIKTLTFDNPDRVSYHFGNPKKSTIDAWYLQGLPRMSDIGAYSTPKEFHDFVGMDRLEEALVNMGLVPPFETRIIKEDEDGRIWMDSMGIVTHDAGKHLKTPGFNTRTFISHPVKNRDDWPAMRERYDPHSPGRFPDDWDEQAAVLRQRDWPVRVAVPSLYWRTRDWLGFENLSRMFYDDPKLVHDMMEHITIFIMEIVRKVHQDMHLDCLMLNEDMAYKHASMISPAMFREFMLPRYKRLAALVKELGVPVFMAECDGHVSELIPLWIEAGIYSTYPSEIAADNDPVAYRKQYGDKMAIWGGIDKRAIRSKEQTYQEVMSKVPWLIEQGGFLPSVDHAVPPDVPLRSYLYMCELIKAIAEGRPVPMPDDHLEIEDSLGPIERMWSHELDGVQED